MKVKAGFMRRRLGTQEVVVAVGEASKAFSGIIRLNETGAFLWDRLAEAEQTEETLRLALLAAYDVSEETAKQDVATFVETMRREGLIENG